MLCRRGYGPFLCPTNHPREGVLGQRTSIAGDRARKSRRNAPRHIQGDVMAKFLSDEWFSKVKELTEDAGDIEVPSALKDLTLNLTVATDEGEKKVHMHGGQFDQGHKADAPVTVILP